MIIAIVNCKGGVGKTTTSVNLAAALAGASRRVLLIDLDSQASASSWCGVQRGRLNPSSASCLLHDHPIRQAVRRTRTPYLDLLTGAPELANADVTLGPRAGRELVLRHALDDVRTDYGAIVIDCAPGLSLLTVNALVAADALIVPITPQHLAVDALDGMLTSFARARSRLATQSLFMGLLLVMIGNGRASTVSRAAGLRTRFSDRLFATRIPASAAFDDAAVAGRPIFDVAPTSAAATAFHRLAREVLDRGRALR